MMTAAFTQWLERELRRVGVAKASAVTQTTLQHLRRYGSVADLLHTGREPLVMLFAVRAPSTCNVQSLVDDIIDQYHLSDMPDTLSGMDSRQNESVDSGLPPSPDTGRPVRAYNDAFPPLSTGASTPADDDVFTDDCLTPPPPHARHTHGSRTSTRTVVVDSFDGTQPQFIVPKANHAVIPMMGSAPTRVGMGMHCPPPPFVQMAQMHHRRQRANTIHETMIDDGMTARQRQASWCESQAQFCVPYVNTNNEHVAPAVAPANSNTALDEILYDRRHFAPIRSGSMSWAYTSQTPGAAAATQRPRAQRPSDTAADLSATSANIWATTLPEECQTTAQATSSMMVADDDDDQLLMFVGGLASSDPLVSDD